MVYLHVPFCKRFCTYCAFYSELFAPVLVRRFEQAVIAEMQSREKEIRQTLQTPTLYLGGGTPSVLPPVVLQHLVDALAGITGGNYAEFTLEVNPDDVTPEYAAFLRQLGVTRVSMGIQSFDPRVLRWMARRHDADGARRAFALLREAGFENISVDLIFGVGELSSGGGPVSPRTEGDWAQEWLEADIQALLALPGGPPEHISAYQLSLEEGSALFRLAQKGRYAELSDELAQRQYLTLCTRLREAGYEHYEISNYARRDGAGAASAYRAVHNSAYWTGAPYVGLGPAAHSYDGSSRSWNPADLSAYEALWIQEEVPGRELFSRAGIKHPSGKRPGNSNSHPGDCSELLTPEQRAMERVMLALRTADGIPEAELRRLCGDTRVDALLRQTCLEKSRINANLRIPERHGFISDTIIAELV